MLCYILLIVLHCVMFYILSIGKNLGTKNVVIAGDFICLLLLIAFLLHD